MRSADRQHRHLREGRYRVREVLRQRRAGEEEHFERPYHALAVARQDALGRWWIDPLHHAVQERQPAAVGNRLEPSAQRLVGWRPRKQSAGKRAIVEPRAADDNRQVASRLDLADGARGIHCELRGGVDLGRIGDVDQVMRNAAAFVERHLVGADVEPAIDRRRVAVDDLAAEALGQRQRQRALAAGGRAENRDDQPFRH